MRVQVQGGRAVYVGAPEKPPITVTESRGPHPVIAVRSEQFDDDLCLTCVSAGIVQAVSVVRGKVEHRRGRWREHERYSKAFEPPPPYAEWYAQQLEKAFAIVLPPDDGRCECGVLLSEHDPLPAPGPLLSWRSPQSPDRQLPAESKEKIAAVAAEWGRRTVVPRTGYRKRATPVDERAAAVGE